MDPHDDVVTEFTTLFQEIYHASMEEVVRSSCVDHSVIRLGRGGEGRGGEGRGGEGRGGGALEMKLYNSPLLHWSCWRYFSCSIYVMATQHWPAVTFCSLWRSR